MKDLQNVMARATAAAEDGLPWCLATLVKIEGSAYRRPGARMIVLSEDDRVGALSGGCLEGEIAEHAVAAMQRGTVSTLTLNDRLEDDPDSFGTGCGGTIHVLLEPAMPDRHPLRLVASAVDRRRPAVLATLVAESDLGIRSAQLLAFADAPGAERDPDDMLDDDLRTAIDSASRDTLQSKQSEVTEIQRQEVRMTVLHEFIPPRPRLVVMGDGYDVEPVITCASSLGWETAIVGRRPLDTLRDTFPSAGEHYFVMHPEQVLQRVSVDPWTAVAIMSHNYQRDRAYLEAVSEAPCFYVGMLGPGRRTTQLLQEAKCASLLQGERFHAPVGLDVGAETPEEIALSLVTEIQAVLRGRRGGKLKDRPGPIHNPVKVRAGFKNS